MPREGSRSGDLQIYGSHTLYTQRLNISDVSQSAKSLQGSFSSTSPKACQTLRALCKEKSQGLSSLAPRFARRLSHFQGSSKENNKEPKRRSSCAVSCLHNPAEPPGVRFHCVCPGAATRRLQTWGVSTEEEGPPKSAPPSTGEPVRSRPPPLAVTEVKVAAAAGEDSLEVHGVRLGDSVRQEGAKGRYGDSGYLGGPLFPSLAGCGEHRGPQQDRGCKRAFRAPPARRSTQHRPGSCFHWGARKAPLNQATVQTSPGVRSHPRAPGSF